MPANKRKKTSRFKGKNPGEQATGAEEAMQDPEKELTRTSLVPGKT
jgi:hypothetical protein